MILIIDDDAAVRSSLTFLLTRAGCRPEAVPGPKEAFEVVRATAPELILMDMNFTLTTTGEEGIQLLRQVKIFRPDVPVILMTAWGSISLAVQGMQAGAFDFITKPWNNLVLLKSIRTALELSEQKKEANAPLNRSDADHKFHFDKIVGQSAALMDVLGTVSRIAPTNASVLITGESGTGKELIAEAIHANSPRSKEAFVKVNLGGLSQSLFESEMFGHKKGAFTDAYMDRVGRFEMANKGTIFLDEIGEMAFDLQAKLLRILETGEFIKIGDTKPTKVDVRIIAATNRDLEKEIELGHFREDLFYRLSVFQIHLPALRERVEDIPLHIKAFVSAFSSKMGKNIRTISPEYIDALKKRAWKGNVRELRNAIERSLIIADGDTLTLDALPLNMQTSSAASTESYSGFDLSGVEKMHIQKVLKYTKGNKTETSRLLGIGLTTLYRKIEEYGL